MRKTEYNFGMRNEQPGIYGGVYSYLEAARLLNIAPPRVRRWADGYTFQRKKGPGSSRPILQTDRYPGVITFSELWELFFVREYIALGVNLQHIRATAEALSKEFGAFPFTNAKLLTNGRRLLIERANGLLQRPDIGQLVADFADSMLPRVEIRDDHVGVYRPESFDDQVYLDREIRGGEPVVSAFAIPTRAIYALWENERRIEAVAEYHDIEPSIVSIAVRYEGQWRLAA